jgi:hypothetical protein
MEHCNDCGGLLLTPEERTRGVCGACFPIKGLLCLQRVRVHADDRSDLQVAGVQLLPIDHYFFRAIFPEGTTVGTDEGTYILPGESIVIVKYEELSLAWRTW